MILHFWTVTPQPRYIFIGKKMWFDWITIEFFFILCIQVNKNEKVVVKADAGTETLKKMEMVSAGTDISNSKPEPIQMPSIFGKVQDFSL